MTFPSGVKPVTQAPDTDQMSGAGGVGLNFLSKVGYVSINDSIGDGCVWTPDQIEKLIALQDSSTIANKGGEHFEFNRSGADGLP